MHPSSAGIRLKLEDLSLLSQGMKRAKNIKEESRCYYTQAAFLHNCCCFEESITCLEKFLKIVLFIKDHKSVELGLNAIGIGYWCLKDYASKHVLLQKPWHISVSTRREL